MLQIELPFHIHRRPNIVHCVQYTVTYHSIIYCEYTGKISGVFFVLNARLSNKYRAIITWVQTINRITSSYSVSKTIAENNNLKDVFREFTWLQSHRDKEWSIFWTLTRLASNWMPLEPKRGIHFATKISPINTNVNTHSSKLFIFIQYNHRIYFAAVKMNVIIFPIFQNTNNFSRETVNVTLAIRKSNGAIVTIFRRA